MQRVDARLLPNGSSARPIKIDLADGPCEICAERDVNQSTAHNGEILCTRCGEPIPGFGQCPDPKIKIRGKIYCTGGTQPIIVDYKIVGCQRC